VGVASVKVRAYLGATGNRPEVLGHLGPYARHPAVTALCDLDERVWETYNELAGGYKHAAKNNREFLITRMLYIAEVTSSAIRLNATWALTHAAMSLLRDRYEQTVRFSWLVRNPDPQAFAKYERGMIGKINSLVRNVSPETRKRFEDIYGPSPDWATQTPTKEQRAFLEEWNALDLKSMAAKRDAFPPLADTFLAKDTLANSYDSIYRQFSSVSHYDRYSIEMLGIQQGPNGLGVLAASPHWPSLLTLQNTHFDMIQCFEAAQVCHKKDAAVTFEAFLAEWLASSKQTVPL
jgi:hypothetical protein